MIPFLPYPQPEVWIAWLFSPGETTSLREAKLGIHTSFISLKNRSCVASSPQWKDWVNTHTHTHIYIYIYIYFFGLISFVSLYIIISIIVSCRPPDIGIMVRVSANGPGNLCRVLAKTQKMVLDASLIDTQRYKVRIKGKVENSGERSSAIPYNLV